MAIVGLGMAFTVSPLTATVMGSVSVAQGGMASAINNTIARIGALLAVAVIGVLSLPLFANALTHRLESLPLEPSVRHTLITMPRTFADMTLPELVPDSERPRIKAVIAEALVDSFRWIALIGAACALAGGVGMLALRGSVSAEDQERQPAAG